MLILTFANIQNPVWFKQWNRIKKTISIEYGKFLWWLYGDLTLTAGFVR